MITIDMIDDWISASKKPIIRTQIITQSAGTTSYDPVYVLMQNQYSKLREAAHTTRLLRFLKSSDVAIDLSRFIEPKRTAVLTLAERYARRAISQLGNG